MNILAIDTSNQVLGIAITKEGQVIGELTTNLKKNQTSRLMPAIYQLMKDIDMTPSELEKIVVAKGPGSYTGVRIGITTAKSLAWALSIPIVGVSSLEALAYQGRFFDSYICPFFDARRGMVFTGLYQWKDQSLKPVMNERNISMRDWLKKLSVDQGKILFLSPNLSLYKEMIGEELGDSAIFPDSILHISKPSDLAYAGMHRTPNETHTLTPSYLRLAEAEANWLKDQGKCEKNG